MKNKIIVFEGLDCSFKETQSTMLLNALTEKIQDINIILQDFPRYTHSSGMVVHDLLHNKYGNISSLPMDVIIDSYALDRACAWYGGMKKEHENGSLYIIDRWVYSNAIYQGTRAYIDSNSTIDAIRTFEHVCDKEFVDYKLPQPDIVFHMDMSVDCMSTLIAAKKDKDVNELDLDYLKNVYKVSNLFYSWANNTQNSKIVRIKCDNNGTPRTREEIHNDIMIEVAKLLDI